MLSLRHLARFSSTRTYSPCITLAKHFHDDFTKDPSKFEPQRNDKLRTTTPAVASKFNVYSDENAPVIFDVDEERQRISEDIAETDDLLDDVYAGLNLERGATGVFEIEDLVEVLRRENAVNIFVCTVPKHLKYVDYLCVVSGRSHRHRLALAQFVRKLFKIKRHRGDVLPKIEGEKSKTWMALDLGNIALHILSENARHQYDIESLWSVGREFDLECNKPADDVVELLENHTLFLKDLMPNTSPPST
ncbi:mitochondrial assembly of ribosomal large subunit protein 1 [Bradysia coprophila]|uniref:mitochondrial assembly of ribosomal large subunit protein 1 n=1 Tax=Bradysia coprophila TaxID=38358 RepID=UPI00187DC2CF|nr:mitochondrial assembly of ribosomal large subunit protein 1 [Bradysia coprophila]